MQRFKTLLQQTRSSLRTLSSHRRASSAQTNYAEHNNDDSQEQIVVGRRAKSRAAILNRPSSLNSLNASIVARLKRLYDSWEENSDVGFVLMTPIVAIELSKTGNRGAFCSGADVVRLYHSLNEERLGKLITDEPSVVESSLAQYGDLVYPDMSSVLHRIDTSDRCFSHETVEEIIEALEKEAAESSDEWCSTTLRRLREASPLSLKFTLQSIREGRFETLDKCIVHEYRISLRGISKHVSSDFFEGVRARMVDKDFAPKWDAPTLEDISEDMVDYHFSPLSKVECELVLPTALRKPYM